MNALKPRLSLLALVVIAAGVGSGALAVPDELPASETVGTESSRADYVFLDADLENLREHFNADRGKVRAIFMASPTCGICLRGVAELQEKMLDTIEADDLVVYVVWSSQLGAEERHVAPGIRLIPDGRAVHYWDPEQLLGIAYQPMFNLPSPVWDYWLLYERNTEWKAGVVPSPDWWEYQGRPVGRPEELLLDAGRFADKTRELLAR